MTGTPAVSFLIPAHDRPRELKAALASCLAQSCEDWEAVVVDDHSEQADLKELVAGFDDERLRYTRLEGDERGVSAARNRIRTSSTRKKNDVVPVLTATELDRIGATNPNWIIRMLSLRNLHLMI